MLWQQNEAIEENGCWMSQERLCQCRDESIYYGTKWVDEHPNTDNSAHVFGYQRPVVQGGLTQPSLAGRTPK